MVSQIVKMLVLLSIFGLMLSFPPDSQAASVTVQWDAPTTNEDGTPVEGLAGFNIYRSSVKGGPYSNKIVIGDPAQRGKVITGLEPGIYYFIATAYNTWGKESKHSNEVMKTAEAPTPSPPSCR